MKKIKTPRDAKGSQSLKILEKTSQSVYQGRLPTRSATNLKHCHSLTGSRQISRIDRSEWEARVGEIHKLYETNRYNRANALYSALNHVQLLLHQAKRREKELTVTSDNLASTSNYLKTLMDSMVDILIATDIDGNISEINKAGERLTGLSRDDLIGSHFSKLFREHQQAIDDMATILSEDQIIDAELTLVRLDKDEIPIMYNATILTDLNDSVSGILITARDISDLKQARQTLEKYAAELTRANTDLEEFTAVASHDLEEPLKEFSGYANRLMMRYKDQFDDEAVQDLDHLVSLSSYMQSLIKNVLEYAKVDNAKMEAEEISIDDVLSQALKNLQGAIDESDVKIHTGSLPVMRVNAAQLVRVFQNLIGNAIKYRDISKEHCEVLIDSENIADTHYHLPENVTYDGVIFSIKDNGLGVEEEYREEIFKMFVRLHTAQEMSGTGLGLAIVWKIIYRHNGHIWVESALGQGSIFHFTIPYNK